MLITNHVLGGALVGLASPGPGTAFAAGVASHVAMDVTPHWGNPDPEVFLRVAVVDGLIGLATMACVARLTPPGRRSTVWAGMLGACLPDADKPSDLFFGRSPFPAAVDRFHMVIQTESPRRMPQEVVVAAVQLLVFGALVRRAARRPGLQRA
ncbi:MAG: hypothetical protein JWR85_663 [Marmoricola sp.]|nr:hypothetical protein [Marmoricola sp.]